MIIANKNQGFVLLEALLAIGLVIIFLGGFGALFVLNVNGSARVHQYEQANIIAESGIQALQTLDFGDLTLKDPARLVFSNPYWTLSDGSETIDDFTRTVRIKEVQRDENCNIVESGGTVDPDSKFIESEVAWSDFAGRNKQILLTSLVTRWDDPQGECFQPTAAGSLVFHVETTLWFGGKQLRELYLENGGSEPITIAYTTFIWDNTKQIDQVFISSVKTWSTSGPGTPTGGQISGVRLDTQDYTINAGQTVEMNKTQFSGSMGGSTLTLILEFTDGSIFTSPSFVPF